MGFKKEFVVLYVEFLDSIKNDPTLFQSYNERIVKHNEGVDSLYPDSGFDLLVPNGDNLNFNKKDEIALIKHGMKCACYGFHKGIYRWTRVDDDGNKGSVHPAYKSIKKWVETAKNLIRPQPFCLYPRSSIWKNGVTLANSVGIIDSGYRGEIMGAFKNHREKNVVKYGNRYLQICTPCSKIHAPRSFCS